MKALRILAASVTLAASLTVCASADNIGQVRFTATSAHAQTEIYDGGLMVFAAYDGDGKLKETKMTELLPAAFYKAVSADFDGRLSNSDTVRAFLLKNGTLAPIAASGMSAPLTVGGDAQRRAMLAIAAENYLDAFPMSRDGLVEQLMFDGYSLDEAVFAAMNADADWTEQARKSALNYMNYVGGFTKTGLLQQLLSDKYTYEQAAVGVAFAFR